MSAEQKTEAGKIILTNIIILHICITKNDVQW